MDAAGARADAARAAQACWVPLGASVDVQGHRIPGPLYVGAKLEAVSGGGEIEPALVVPRLPARSRHPDRLGQTMGYRPSYSELTEPARTAYLNWLQGSRRAGAYIGYVFLFFYGIERRVLVDAQCLPEARAEVPALKNEVYRLLELYGDNHSFRGYVHDFLYAVRVIEQAGDVSAIDPPMAPTGWDFRISLKLALGTFAARGEPVPARWALSWLRSHPASWLRTPAERCPEEFNYLFKTRYQDRLGEGLRVSGRRILRLSYHAASASFGGDFELEVPGLLDVTGLEAPLAQLRAIGDEVCDDLDAYSRWVGKHNDRTSLAAIALLPRDLRLQSESPERARLAERLTSAIGVDGLGVIPAAELTDAWPQRNAGRLAKAEAEQLIASIEGQGFGIEPDIRFGGSNVGGARYAVVFKLSPEAGRPKEAFRAAATVLRLAAAVVLADGAVHAGEQQRLEALLEDRVPLTEAERIRLRALTRWLLLEDVGLGGIKQALDPMDEAERAAIGQFLISIAAADGVVVAKEITTLTRLYKLLGLDPTKVHSDLHQMTSSAEVGPIPVSSADVQETYQLPPAPLPAAEASPNAPSPDATSPVTLDPMKIAQIMSSTAEVTAMLSAVFEANDAPVEEPDDDDPAEVIETSVAGLDAPHARFVEFLLERSHWSREDFDQLARRLELLPGGAMETVNELAFDRCGSALLVGDDPVELDASVAEELVRGR